MKLPKAGEQTANIGITTDDVAKVGIKFADAPKVSDEQLAGVTADLQTQQNVIDQTPDSSAKAEASADSRLERAKASEAEFFRLVAETETLGQRFTTSDSSHNSRENPDSSAKVQSTSADSTSRALAESMRTALYLLPETSDGRSLLASLCASLQKASVEQAVIQACESFDDQRSKREEEHRADKRALRSEVCEVQSRCDRLLKGREALEKQINVVCSQLRAVKEINQHLERRVRGEHTQQQSAPRAKRARTGGQQAGGAKGKATSIDTEADFVRSLVALEVGPLHQCTKDSREALKKRILLKWHPDKQPSEHHKSLATQVMQELQNSAEWKQ
jgi:septal ring factor EnvC (AmiA/AmiB activator)